MNPSLEKFGSVSIIADRQHPAWMWQAGLFESIRVRVIVGGEYRRGTQALMAMSPSAIPEESFIKSRPWLSGQMHGLYHPISGKRLHEISELEKVGASFLERMAGILATTGWQEQNWSSSAGIFRDLTRRLTSR